MGHYSCFLDQTSSVQEFVSPSGYQRLIALYRWPARLGDIHRRGVIQRCRRLHILLLEKLIGPRCGRID